MTASARETAGRPGKNVKAKRKLNDSLAEAVMVHVGKLLSDEAVKLSIPTVSVLSHGTSQTRAAQSEATAMTPATGWAGRPTGSKSGQSYQIGRKVISM